MKYNLIIILQSALLPTQSVPLSTRRFILNMCAAHQWLSICDHELSMSLFITITIRNIDV